MIEDAPLRRLRRGLAEKTIDVAAQPAGVEIPSFKAGPPAFITPGLARKLIWSGTLPDHRAAETSTPRGKVSDLAAQHLASVSVILP